MAFQWKLLGLLNLILFSWMTAELSAQQTSGELRSQKTETEDTNGDNPQPSPILGIDVSHFQGNVNWQKVKDANIRFVYDKATQGNHFTDPNYAENKKGAHAFGLLHGSYHFYTSDKGGKEQADLFIGVIDFGPGDMPPMLDLEQASIKGNVDIPALQKEILIWLIEVENKLDVKPIIYTNHPFGNRYLNHADFKEYELWIAEYGVEKPKIPSVWQDKGWLIWQRSERGTIEGVIGEVDHDLFNPDRPFNSVVKK